MGGRSLEKKKIIGIIFLALTVIMWGVSFVSIQIAMKVLPPLNLAFYRLLIAIVMLFVMMKLMTPARKMQKKHIPRFALSGIVGITLYFYFENSALVEISANTASIIVAFLPVSSMVGEVIFLKKKIRPLEVLGIVTSIVGVYMVIGANLGDGGSAKGYILMLVAVLCYSIFQLASKPLFDDYSDLEVGFYQTLFALLAFLPVLHTEVVRWENWDLSVASHFVFLAVCCSGLATYFYMYSLNHLGITISSVFLNLMPVVTFITSFLFFGEKLTLIQSLGSIIVILSVSVITVKSKVETHEIKS